MPALRILLMFFYSSALLAASVSTSQAGAWVQNRGAGLAITTFSWYESSSYWDRDRNRHESPRYRKFEINPLIEHGVTDVLTIGVNAFFDKIDAAGQGNNIGMSDVELLARYRIWHNVASTVTTQLLVKIPEAYDEDDLPLLGQGQYDIEGRILFGTGGNLFSWPGGSWFFGAEGGIRKRFEEPADEMKLDWIAGWKSSDRTLEFHLKQENIFGLRNQKGSASDDPYHERSTDYDLNKLSLSALYWPTHPVALQIGVNHDVFGRNTGRGTAPFIGLWIRF